MGKAAVKRKAKRPIEIVDYVARIERSSLAYGLNNHRAKHMPLRPHGRLLLLYGRLVLPEALFGLPFDVVLQGDTPQPVEPEEELSAHVGTLTKTGDNNSVFAIVPPDFIPALSAAFHDGRMSLVHARGPALKRGYAPLIGLKFEDVAYFEDHWGEAIPSPA